MNTSTKELASITSDLCDLGLPTMAKTLQKIYDCPDFINMGRLEIIGKIVSAQHQEVMQQRFTGRLKRAKLFGYPSSLDECVNSSERTYQPDEIISTLSSLKFIHNGYNLCIFGASDSGKTYLAKALGICACEEFRVSYWHTEDLLGELASIRGRDFSQYKKKLRCLTNYGLIILDDFLLHPITSDLEIKALYDILEYRGEAHKSCIICSQRDPESWPGMLMQDEVSSNSILKRVTRDYNVIIKRVIPD